MSFRLTDRDMQLLLSVSRFRFLTAEQLQRIDGGSARGVRNRLLHLTRAGHLLRLRSSLTSTFAYGLGTGGARLLAMHGQAINPRLDWADKNDRTQFFLAHTTQIADVILHVERAASGVARLRDHHELMSCSPGFGNDPVALRVPVSLHDRPHVIPIIPDRLFALTYPDTTMQHFALELDRGTMDIWANRLVGKSSFRRKLMAYAAAREQKRFTDVWGCKSLRVLTVTTSATRIEHMLCAQRRAIPHCPAGFFLYATMDDLARHGALGPAWTTIKGGHASIAHQMSTSNTAAPDAGRE
jgi:hypothetical protein